MSKHGEGYIEDVPHVTGLLEAACYYDYPYQRKTEHTTRGHWFDADEAKAYFFARGHWVGDACDLIAQGNMRYAENEAVQSMIDIGCEHPDWIVDKWPMFIEAYHHWLLRYPRRKLIDVQGYVHHKTLHYQGRYDQRWILEPGEPETILDIKCVADGAHCQKCTALQLAAYDDALGPLISGVASSGNPNPYYLTHRKRLGLALHSDGTFFKDDEKYIVNGRPFVSWRDYPNWRNLVTYHQIHGEKGEYR